MAAPLLYISRLLPDPVMAAARQQFRLLNEPRDTAPADATLGAGIREADAAICTLTDRIDAKDEAAGTDWVEGLRGVITGKISKADREKDPRLAKIMGR